MQKPTVSFLIDMYVGFYITQPLFWYTMYRLAIGYADRKIREAEGCREPVESNIKKFFKGVGIYILIYILVFICSGNFQNFRNSMSSVAPIVILICFVKLYIRMGEASYLTTVSHVNPDHVKDVSKGEVLGYIAAVQAATSIAIHNHDKRKKKSQ
jgi:ACR3 family arsenite efflux pump ArsB